MSVIRRILLPTDFSKTAAAAHQHAVEMAKAHGAEIYIVHVLPVSDDGRPLAPAEVRQSVQVALDFLVSSTEKAGARGRSILVTGQLADGVIEAARSSKADMLVLGVTPPAGDVRWPALTNHLVNEPIRVTLVPGHMIQPNPDFLLPTTLQAALPGIPVNPASVPKVNPTPRPKPKRPPKR